MAQVSGSDVVVALYHETAWGVDPGTPDGRKAYFTALNVAASQNMIDDATISGGRGTRRSGRGNLDVAGNIDMVIAPTQIGFFLKHLLGTPTTTGASAPYTHTFKPTTLPAGFIIEKDWTSKIASKVERFNGCRIASAQFNFPQEGFATASFSIAGQRYSINAAALDATLTDPGHTGFSGFQGIVKRGGSQIGGVMSMQLGVENNMDTSIYTFPANGGTAGRRGALPEGRCKIRGTLEMIFEDFTLVDLALAGTETTAEVIYTHGTGAGTAGNESLSFLIDHLDIPLTSPSIETESGLKISVPFSGFASGADMGLLVTLKNALAAADL